MSREPIWRLLHQCAIKLTEAGRAPFTRAELIGCVRETIPDAKESSINPIIQGITDNLKGGAPRADGKRILHSVGRGRFVLRSADHQEEGAESPEPVQTHEKSVETQPPNAGGAELPRSESEFRDLVLVQLQDQLRDVDCVVVPEGRVYYSLPSGQTIGHASDILVSDSKSGKQVSIEVKYRSAVTDQFKCRAYDAMHMKKQHGASLLTVMLFAKSDSGISINQARFFCYPFDRFYGGPAPQFLTQGGISEMSRDIMEFLTAEGRPGDA